MKSANFLGCFSTNKMLIGYFEKLSISPLLIKIQNEGFSAKRPEKTHATATCAPHLRDRKNSPRAVWPVAPARHILPRWLERLTAKGRDERGRGTSPLCTLSFVLCPFWSFLPFWIGKMNPWATCIITVQSAADSALQAKIRAETPGKKNCGN